MTALRLHDYWRSSAGYRVRIAIALKGVAVERVTHDLRTGAHSAPAYAALQPQRLVPVLEVDGQAVLQSYAIIEWLDETYPDPPLLPADPLARATARGMAALIACDIHPLNNLRVLNALRANLGADEAQVSAWIGRWTGAGFAALETLIERHGGAYAYGDTPGIVDCHLVPQVYSARRFAIDLTPYPRLMRAAGAAGALASVASAHPDEQEDAGPA